MLKTEEMLHFIDRYENPVYVINLEDYSVIYRNEKAKNTYDIQGKITEFNEILQDKAALDHSKIKKQLLDQGFSVHYDLNTLTTTGNIQLADLEFQYFDVNHTKIYVEIREKVDKRMEMALYQINQSHRPEALLHFDDTLTIIHYNKAFQEVFHSKDALQHSYLKNHLINGFPAQSRDKILCSLIQTMSVSPFFSTKIQIFTETGEARWFLLECEQRTLDHSGAPIIFASMTNIQKEMETEERFTVANQYLSVLQKSTENILYRVDVASGVMYHYSDFTKGVGKEKIIPNYVEVFTKEQVVHPEDADIYHQNLQNFYQNDIDPPYPVRFSFDGNQYQWYKITAIKIFEADGSLKEVFGALVNVDTEQKMKKEATTLTQYFNAMQSLSGESLYTVDLTSRTLKCQGITAEELGLSNKVNDYIHGVTHLVHPDHLDAFMNFTVSRLAGTCETLQLKLRNINGAYQWYELTSFIIRDETETPVEILGKIKNIQNLKTMQAEVSSVYNYLEGFQSVSHESFNVFNLETKTLTQKGSVTKELGIEGELHNFPACVFSFIHPEDLSYFKAFVKEALNGDKIRVQTRIKTIKNEYQWYDLCAQGIMDEEGIVTEIVGKIGNIQNQKSMQAEMSTLNKYFAAAQEFTSDILYRIDMKTQTLYHSYQSKRALEIGQIIPNYLETLVNEKIVHPDDGNMYLENTKQWLLDSSVTCEARFNIVTDDYRWYSIRRKKIYDHQGNFVEILGALVSVHKERQLKENFEEATQYFKVMQELSDDIFYRVEVDSMTLHHSLDSPQKITQKKAIPDYVTAFIEEKVIHPDDVDRYLEQLSAFNKGSLDDVTARFALLSDEYHWYRACARRIYDENGNVVEYWGRLISEHNVKIAQKQLSEVNLYFSALQDLSDDILFHIDVPTKTFVHSDKRAIENGMETEIPDYVEVFIKNNIIPPETHQAYRDYTQRLFAGEEVDYKTKALVGNDLYEWFDIKCKHIYDESGTLVEIFGKMVNIQSQKNLEERAYHDLMTGALNKATFEEQAGHILETSSPDENHALIFIDLDDFKGVNDNLGHSYGDSLLATVGKRLRRVVRADDLVGRIGGDEFAVLLRHIDSETSVLVRTNLMLESLHRKFSFDQKVIAIKASVGVAIYPQHGKNYKDLIGKSDIAVYESKRRGKNVVSIYSSELEKE